MKQLLALYRTSWAGLRSKWVPSTAGPGCLARYDWTAVVVIEIDELRLRELVDSAVRTIGKRVQRGPLRLRLENFQEKERV